VGGLLGKNRDRVSIVAAILKAAHSGSNKTRIMSNANLSFSLLEKYLDVTINAGLVFAEGSKYKLTGRGQEFLNQYKIFEKRYAMAQKMLEALSIEREMLNRFCEGSKIIQ